MTLKFLFSPNMGIWYYHIKERKTKTMAEQYIGARYVPIVYENPDDHSASWKANVEYEPLTIVVADNGDSYTSKKAVPKSVGAPQDNPEYWVKTGDFNASLLALQGRVNTIEGDLNTPVTGIKARVTTAENDIDGLETQIGSETLTTTAQTLSGAINELDSEYTVFLFDSWGSWVNTDNVTLAELIPANMGLNANQYKSYVANGYGFSRSGYQFLTFLQSKASELASVASLVKRIVVLGGANDPYTWTTVLADIGTFCDYAKATYPNAEICIGHLSTPRADKNAISNWQDNKSLLAYQLCGAHGARYLTGVEYIVHDSEWFNDDMVHPNPSGVALCALAVPSAILGGEAHMANEIQPTATFNTSQTTYSAGVLGGSIRELQNDGTCYLEFRQSGTLNLELAVTGIPAGGLGSVKVMTLNKKIIIGDGYNNCAILGMALARTPNANVGYIPCIVAIDGDGDLMVTLCMPAMSTIDFSGVTVLNIMLAGRIFAPSDKC